MRINGFTLAELLSYYFGGTATTNAIWFSVDPDAKVTDGTTNGPGKAVEFWLYYNGAIRTYGGILNNSCGYAFGNNCTNPDPTRDPPWFSWD
jgi:hypothetical protein